MPRFRQYEQLPEKPRKKYQTVILILCAFIVTYIGYGVWLKHVSNAPTPSMKKLCNAEFGQCQVILSGGTQSIELNVNPTPIRVGKTLTFEVRLFGINPQSVYISIAPFGGINSSKDKNIPLKQIGNNTYSIQTKLTSKLTHEESWIVLVRITSANGDYAIPFTFTSASKEKTLLESFDFGNNENQDE